MMKNYALIQNGFVTNIIVWDGVQKWESPSGFDLQEIPANAAVSIGWTFSAGQFIAPEELPVPLPTESEVLRERSARLTAATREIDPLQDLIDLGESTLEDEAKLTEWKTYRAAVSKVQTQAGYPESLVWPQEPAL